MVSERRKPVNKEVTFKLNDEEIVEKAKQAGLLRNRKAVLQEEFGRVKASYKGRIEAIENDISELLTAIDTGSITKQAEVVEVFDYDTNEVFVEHQGQVVETREMTYEEKQNGLRMKQPELPGIPATSKPVPPGIANPEPWEVTLPDPATATGPVHVPGESDRPTIVKHLAITWRQEAGEAATYEVTTEDAFGTPVLTWRRSGTLDVAPPPAPEAPAETPHAEEVPQ